MRLEVACTIAALVGAEEIGVKHLAEALQFRVLDRSG
jgi:predicted ATPase with chaperone activity